MFESWFKTKNQPTPQNYIPPEILGFRLGGAVQLNALKLKLLDDLLITDNISKIQLIQAVGMVNLDESSTILRYYTDDEAFIQIVLTGGMNEEHVTDVKLFHFYSTAGINTQQEWEDILANKVSQVTYTLEGKIFSRVWEAVGDCPPLAMSEGTTLNGETTSQTDQFLMLYEAEIGSDLAEYLLVSAEEKLLNNQVDRCLVISTGINLGRTDFEIIG